MLETKYGEKLEIVNQQEKYDYMLAKRMYKIIKST